MPYLVDLKLGTNGNNQAVSELGYLFLQDRLTQVKTVCALTFGAAGKDVRAIDTAIANLKASKELLLVPLRCDLPKVQAVFCDSNLVASLEDIIPDFADQEPFIDSISVRIAFYFKRYRRLVFSPRFCAHLIKINQEKAEVDRFISELTSGAGITSGTNEDSLAGCSDDFLDELDDVASASV